MTYLREAEIRNVIHKYLLSVANVIEQKQRNGYATQETKSEMNRYLKELKRIDDDTVETRRIRDFVDLSG